MTIWKCVHCGKTLAVLNEHGEFTLRRVAVHGDKDGLQIICPQCRWRNIWERLDKSQRIGYNQNVT